MSFPQVELNTNKGRIVLELNTEKAPKTAENFLQYVRDGFYDGVIFHRVIDGFMIQGGGFDENFKEKATRDAIINVKNNSFLNHTGKTAQGWGYAVFGKVVEGMDVVNEIKNVRTGNRGYHADVPLENVVIESAKIISE